MQLFAINVAVKKVSFNTVVGMVITTMEHLLCKAALGQKLNCTTVGIIQLTWDCVAQMLLWNVSKKTCAPQTVRMVGYSPPHAPATVQLGSLE